MIRRFFCALMVLLLLSSGAFARELPGMVRLHVLAESNSPADQALKLEIRDACLDCARSCVAGAPDADAAYMRLERRIGDFRAACLRRTRQLGYGGRISVETGIFPFPDRVYGDVLVPAGEYRALRVTIGAGQGRNWWCVLYPNLCSLDESASGLQDVLSWIRRRIGGESHA